MNSPDIDKAYVSPYDKFLFGFDAKHEKTLSQLKEMKKHERIAKLRDEAQPDKGDNALWDEF